MVLRFSKYGFHFYYFKYYRVLAVSFISSLMIGLMLTPVLLSQKQRPGAKVSLKNKIEADTASSNQ
jgi:hypothetical protein